MSFELEGKLHKVFEINQVNEKFKKRDFIIEKVENVNGIDFTDLVKFQLTQDRCGIIDGHKEGERLKIFFNIRGRKWEKDGNVNYFTNLEAWRITVEEQGESKPAQATQDIPAEDDVDDLPF